MGSENTPAQIGRYARAAAAPEGLRRVMKMGELERAMARVGEWRIADAKITEERRALVRDLRGRGASWDSIGWLLGTTGRAVQKRFSRDVPK